ncbi:MAG: 30S ribosomal protein S9 [Candidatus Sungbacteria bacterium]|nr:30S ribosomal protein S9 [Candidatus Sungbacteria bacterium]
MTEESVKKKPAKSAAKKSGEEEAAERESDAYAQREPLSVKSLKPDRYFEAVGRRKTARARARLFTRAGEFTVNGKAYGTYFPTVHLQYIAEDALKKMKLLGRFRVSAKITGGGIHSQAEALRHALSRCLIAFNPDFRKRLKRAGFVTRDPRMKERKKFGLKKARRAPQWQKR